MSNILISVPKAGRTWLRYMVAGATAEPFDYGHPYRGKFQFKDSHRYFLLVRHPFDVSVSYWHHYTEVYQKDAGNRTEFLLNMLERTLRDYEKLYAEYLGGRFVDYARYEDMVIDPARVLKQFLSFLGVEGDIEAGLLAGSWEKNHKADPKKFRRGIIGGYRDLDPIVVTKFYEELHKHDAKKVWGYA